MAGFPFVSMRVPDRGDPLGPSSLNQMHSNARSLEGLALVEHFNTGKHNAAEIPWLAGRIADGSPPTGFLFDTTFGGSSFSRPATGEYTINVASGLVPTNPVGDLIYSAMANVADSAIESKPHTITVEPTSPTSFKVRVRGLSSALGSGDTWSSLNRSVDFALHAPQQPRSNSLLLSNISHVRKDHLTEQPTDWNALVQNQGYLYGALTSEHDSAGNHNANRIAKAAGWFPWSGSSYSFAAGDGVSSVSRLSVGVIEVTMRSSFASTNSMVCFPEVQPATASELVIINGRGFNSGSTSTFRFYIYAFDGANWSRADRTFFSPFFGVIS